MLMAHGFLKRIFEIFDRYETPVDMLATSEVSVSLTIDNTSSLPAITREIEEFAEVTVEDSQAIVCMVGDNIRHTPGIASRAFDVAEEHQCADDFAGRVAAEYQRGGGGGGLEKRGRIAPPRIFYEPGPGGV